MQQKSRAAPFLPGDVMWDSLWTQPQPYLCTWGDRPGALGWEVRAQPWLREVMLASLQASLRDRSVEKALTLPAVLSLITHPSPHLHALNCCPEHFLLQLVYGASRKRAKGLPGFCCCCCCCFCLRLEHNSMKQKPRLPGMHCITTPCRRDLDYLHNRSESPAN